MIIGGIYEENGEYAVSDGENLFWIYDGIHHLHSEVDIGGNSRAKHVDGYALKVNTQKKAWSIVDTGHKQGKDVLASGSYTEDFYASLGPMLRVFSKP